MMKRAGSRRRGMTLVELLLAMAGTGFVGAAIAAMLVAVSYGTDTEREVRALVVRHKTIDARLSAALRSAHKVLAISDGDNPYLILWMHDGNGDDAPNLSELRRIELVNGVLISYKAPEDLSPAGDTAYTLDDNFNAITNALKGGGTFPGEIWATEVMQWEITLDDDDPHEARLVSYRFTLQSGVMSDTAINAVSMRN